MIQPQSAFLADMKILHFDASYMIVLILRSGSYSWIAHEALDNKTHNVFVKYTYVLSEESEVLLKHENVTPTFWSVSPDS